MKQKELLDILRDWLFMERRTKILKDRLAAHNYSITACYGGVGGGRGGIEKSRVEKFCITRSEIIDELSQIEKITSSVMKAIEKATISPLEKEIIQAVMDGTPLKSFAEEHHIYKSAVYKKRDGAIRKILAVLDM